MHTRQGDISYGDSSNISGTSTRLRPGLPDIDKEYIEERFALVHTPERKTKDGCFDSSQASPGNQIRPLARITLAGGRERTPEAKITYAKTVQGTGRNVWQSHSYFFVNAVICDINSDLMQKRNERHDVLHMFSSSYRECEREDRHPNLFRVYNPCCLVVALLLVPCTCLGCSTLIECFMALYFQILLSDLFYSSWWACHRSQ